MRRCIVVGASCRALAESLRHAGVDVLAIDLFADRDLTSIATACSVPDLGLDSIRQAIPNGLSSETWVALAGGMEDSTDSIAWLAERFQLLGPNPAQLIGLRDHKVWKSLAEQSGMDFPRTCNWPPTCNDRGSQLDLGSMGIWKPLRGSGGIHAARWNLASRDISEANRIGVEGCLQEYIDGEVFGCSYFSDGTKCSLFCVTRSLTESDWPGPAPFIYRGSLHSERLPFAAYSLLDRLGETIRREYPFVGWFGVDILCDRSHKLWLLEINPRWTASMELASQHLLRDWVNTLLGGITRGAATHSQLERAATFQRDEPNQPTFVKSGNELPPAIPCGVHTGKAIYYLDRDIFLDQKRLDQIWNNKKEPSELLQTGKQTAIDSRGLWLADIPKQEQLFRKGTPLVSLFAAMRFSPVDGPHPSTSTDRVLLDRLSEFRASMSQVLL